MPFAFMQSVGTPRGNGYFIHYMTDGIHCQVAIRERGIQRNPIFRNDEITEAKAASKPTTRHEPVLQVVDVP